MDYDNISLTLLPYLSYPLHGMIFLSKLNTKTQKREDTKKLHTRFPYLRVFASSCLCVYKKNRLPVHKTIPRTM
jgi:hypothetical protein